MTEWSEIVELENNVGIKSFPSLSSYKNAYAIDRLFSEERSEIPPQNVYPPCYYEEEMFIRRDYTIRFFEQFNSIVSHLDEKITRKSRLRV